MTGLSACIRCFLGQSEWPPYGIIFALYGRTKSMQLIDDALAGKLVRLAGQGIMPNCRLVARHSSAEMAHRVAVALWHYNLGLRLAQRQSKADLAVRDC